MSKTPPPPDRDTGEPALLTPETRFEVSEYRSDGACPPRGVILLLFVMLVAAVGLGWLTSFVGQWLYLLLIFPVLLGAALGFVGWFAIHLGKVRHGTVSLLIGIGCAVRLSV